MILGAGRTMAVPDDADKVLTAIRLGWTVAEVRGRNRPDAPPGANAELPGPQSQALPLHIEQTKNELRIEAQKVLGAMARGVNLDKTGEDQPGWAEAIDSKAEALYWARRGAAPAAAGAAGPGGAASGGAVAPGDPAAAGAAAAPAEVSAGGVAAAPAAVAAPDGAAPAVGGAPPAAAGDPDKLWADLQELIFKFDEHVQDTLAAGPDTIACGYQLGRALAEPYWALNPRLGDNAPSPEAWHFLLGKERCPEMGRLVGRLSRYFHEYTPAAIAGSVQIWKHVAADSAWRRDDCLYQQVRRWYELVVMDQDPTTLVQPGALIRNFRLVLRALRIFWPELIGTVIAAAALSGFAVALGQNHISSLAKTALGFIAITGFSAAGLTAKLKNQAQAMVTRLRQDVYTDLVAVAITTAPPMPNVKRPAAQNAKMVRMARERKITPVTPN